MLLDLFFTIINTNTNVQVKLRKKTMKQHARAANDKHLIDHNQLLDSFHGF